MVDERYSSLNSIALYLFLSIIKASYTTLFNNVRCKFLMENAHVDFKWNRFVLLLLQYYSVLHCILIRILHNILHSIV